MVDVTNLYWFLFKSTTNKFFYLLIITNNFNIFLAPLVEHYLFLQKLFQEERV